MAETFAAEARCEPDPRPGTLTVSDERVTFARNETVVFDVPRSESTPDWLHYLRRPRFDLYTPRGRFRLHLSRAAMPTVTARLTAPAKPAPTPAPGPQLLLAVPADEHPPVCLAFGPYLAVGQSNGVIVLWDLTTRRPVRHFVHDLLGRPVRAAAFSADGAYLATAGDDGMVKLRDLHTGKVLVKRLHPGQVRAVAFDPEANRLATVCTDGTLRVWNRRGTLVAQMPGACTAATSGVAFSREGTELITQDPAVRGWEIATGRERVATGREKITTGRETTAPGWGISPGIPAQPAGGTSVQPAGGAFAQPAGASAGPGLSGHFGALDPALAGEAERLVTDFAADAEQRLTAVSRDGTLVAAATRSEIRVWRLGSAEADQQ